ncbi:MAG: energy-coupling factor transporter transmembrane component T [Clostridium paraputrificum]
MKDTFSTYHPIINFTYLIAVILLSMFFMHPVFLLISLISSMLYSIKLKGVKALRFDLLYMLPMLLFFVAINVLLNHRGATILLYINDKALTLEGIVYAICSSVMFISVIIWFSCYNEIMTSDKFIYLFGRVIPSASLIFSMVLRFVPRIKEQIKVISNGQKSMGRDVTQGNLFKRIRSGMNILSILITWVLEDSIDTADSMNARGYGLNGRTSFSIYRFDKRDKIILLIIVLLIGIVLVGGIAGVSGAVFFPTIKLAKITKLSIISYVAYGVLCLMPIILDTLEELKWKLLK